MSGQEGERAARLGRERTLYEYSSALERGDFEAVAAVLREAEADEVLERMILAVNDVYRAEGTGAELAGVRAPAGERGRVTQGLSWLAARGRRGGKMAGGDVPSRLRAVAPGWIAGGVVVVVVLMCLTGWALFSALGTAGRGLTGADSDGGSEAYAPQAVETVVVEREVMVDEPAAPMEPGPGSFGLAQSTPAAGQPAQERLIIRTGTITLKVEDTLAAQQAVDSLVAQMASDGAYVVASQQYSSDEGQDPYITMSIRVPAARFGEVMDTLAGLAVEVVDRNENADDVTEEYVDLAGRLEALEAARDRLLEIMSEAQRTEDLLQAEAQLTQREAEIEAIQGRMQYLSQSAALALITVYLQPDELSQPVVDETWRPAETVRNATEALLDAGQGLVEFAIFFAIAVLPWLLALALGIYVLYRLVRWAVRRRARRGVADS